MKISFLGQGWDVKSNNAVGKHLIKYLKLKNFDSFTGISAFASESGVYGLEAHLLAAKSHFNSLTLIVGMDLDGTSKEALERILALNIKSFVFYANGSPIFHPKIYLFEGKKETKIIIGSTNLTQGGLFFNVESSTLIEFDANDKEGLTFLKELKDYYKTLFKLSDPNLFKINKKLILDFFSDGKIPDEATRRSNYVKNPNTTKVVKSATSKSVPKRARAKVPADFAKKTRKAIKSSVVTKATSATTAVFQPVMSGRHKWTLLNSQQVLIAEIGGGPRWKQISFQKENFQNFFNLPTSARSSGDIYLKYVQSNGVLQTNVEKCSSVAKDSGNWNLEPDKVSESKVPYNTTNKPIILFIKLGNSNFVYHFETNGTSLYRELRSLLPSNRVGARLKRMYTDVGKLRAGCPSLKI